MLVRVRHNRSRGKGRQELIDWIGAQKADADCRLTLRAVSPRRSTRK